MSLNKVERKIIIWLGAVSLFYFALAAYLFYRASPAGQEVLFLGETVHTSTWGEIIVRIIPALILGIVTLAWAVSFYNKHKNDLPPGNDRTPGDLWLGIVGFVFFTLAALVFYDMYPTGKLVAPYFKPKGRFASSYYSTWGNMFLLIGPLLVFGAITLATSVYSYVKRDQNT